MIRLLQSKGTGIFRFAEKSPKGVGQHLKMKKAEALSSKIAEGNVPTPENLAISHRLLYVQYVPAVIMAVPSLYYLGDPSSILFNNALNLMQYYLSGLLCFNSFFAKTSTIKHYALLFGVAAVNCVTGPWSMSVPILLGALNLYFPFTDEKYHKFETTEHEARVKTYLRVQGLFYFLVAALLTLKYYHFQEVRQLEKKLDTYQAENTAFFTLTHNQ